MPITYEEEKEQHQAREQAELRKTQATDKRNHTERTVSRFITSWKLGRIGESDRYNLETLLSDLSGDAGGTYRGANELMRYFVQSGKSFLEDKNDALKSRGSESSLERVSWKFGDRIPLLCGIATGIIVLLIVAGASGDFGIGLIVGVIAGVAGTYVIGIPAALLFEGLESGGKALRIRSAKQLESAADSCMRDLESTASQWQYFSQKELDKKIQEIWTERDNAIAAIRERYRQQGL